MNAFEKKMISLRHPHPAFGTPLPRAGEGNGVRARRAAIAMRELDSVLLSAHQPDATGSGGSRIAYPL